MSTDQGSNCNKPSKKVQGYFLPGIRLRFVRKVNWADNNYTVSNVSVKHRSQDNTALRIISRMCFFFLILLQ